MECCRVCLQAGEKLTSFNHSNCVAFKSLTGIKIQDPGSEYLCDECINRLQQAMEFRKEALNSDKLLQEQRMELAIKNKDPTIKEEIIPEQIIVKVEEIMHPDVDDENYPDMEDGEYNPIEDLKIGHQEEIIGEIKPKVERHGKVGKSKNNVAPTPVSCKVCNEVFMYKTHLRYHLAKFHKSAKLYTCTFPGCDRKFDIEHSMKRHLNYYHSDQEKYICEHCAKVSKTRGSLKIHMRLHTGEKPYKCPEENCESRFVRQCDLYYHKKSVHSTIRGYVCDDCGSAYKLRSGLRAHQKLKHGDRSELLQCPDCDQQFVFPNKLEKHQAIKHRGERNFLCIFCPNTYTNSHHLKRHYEANHPEHMDEVNEKKLHLQKSQNMYQCVSVIEHEEILQVTV